MLLLLMFLAMPSPDIQHLRALAMFLCIVCTRPPPDPILDTGHRLIGDRENMLIGRNVYATFVAHPTCVFPDDFTNNGFFNGNVRALFRFMQDHLSTKDEFASQPPSPFFSVGPGPLGEPLKPLKTYIVMKSFKTFNLSKKRIKNSILMKKF